MPYSFRTYAGGLSFSLAGNAAVYHTGDGQNRTLTGAQLAIFGARSATPRGPYRLRPAVTNIPPDALTIPVRVCSYDGTPLRTPPRPDAPTGDELPVTSFDAVNVAALPLGAHVFAPETPGAPVWSHAVLTRTPTAMLPGEVYGGGLGATGRLSTARLCASLPLDAVTRDMLRAILAGLRSPPDSGLFGFPAVTLDGFDGDGRPTFSGGGVSFTLAGVTTLANLSGPDDSRVLFVIARDPPEGGSYLSAGETFACVHSSFRV